MTGDGGRRPDGGGWHLWLGSGVKRPRCAVCGRRWLVFRYTDSVADVWVCRRHRHVVPDGPP